MRPICFVPSHNMTTCHRDANMHRKTNEEHSHSNDIPFLAEDINSGTFSHIYKRVYELRTSNLYVQDTSRYYTLQVYIYSINIILYAFEHQPVFYVCQKRIKRHKTYSNEGEGDYTPRVIWPEPFEFGPMRMNQSKKKESNLSSMNKID